jgi:hypothetical protein
MKNMNKDLRAKQHLEDDNTQSLPSALDREIDAALARYSNEPRPGLEDRVLANLRTDRERTSVHNWWQWAAASSLATLLLVASIIFLRSNQTSQHYAAGPSQTTRDNASNRIPPAAGPQSALETPTLRSSSQRKKPQTRGSRHASALAAGPKLDQFPSPRPLTEQEKILKRYISNFPEEAILIARARAAEAQREDFGKDSDGSISNGEEDSQR